MKKNYFFGAAALCGLLAFTSCGNDDDPILDGPGNEVATGEQVIVLDMQDTDVLSTKSRPLYSTDNRGIRGCDGRDAVYLQRGSRSTDVD